MNYDATEAEIDENVEAYREWLMAQRAKIRESFDGVKGMIYAPVAMFEVVTFDMLERTQRQTRSELLWTRPIRGIATPAMSIVTHTHVQSLSELLHSPIPAIAVSFADEVTDRDLTAARAEGLDVAELRIDRYASTDPDHVRSQAKRYADFATIATIRTDDEGGQWDGSDDDRLALFRAVLPEVHGIDIELNSMSILPQVVEAAKELGKIVIISNHNFEITPSIGTFEEMAHRAKDLGADFVKLSAMANSPEDLRTLAAFTVANADLGLIIVAMGEHGTASRVFFPALGSRLTYAYANAWPVSGQLTYQHTFDELRLYYPEFNQKKIIELAALAATLATNVSVTTEESLTPG